MYQCNREDTKRVPGAQSRRSVQRPRRTHARIVGRLQADVGGTLVDAVGAARWQRRSQSSRVLREREEYGVGGRTVVVVFERLKSGTGGGEERRGEEMATR